MNTSYASTFTQHLDSLLSESIIFLFHNSSRCSAVITITLLFLQLLVSWGQRGNDGLCGGFLETWKNTIFLEEYKAPSSLSLRQYPPEVLHCSGNRISVTSGKDLTFITNVFLLLKCDWNYNKWDFETIRKAQMQSCGKTKSMSTSKAHEINNIKKLTILRLRNVSRKDCGIIVSDVE